MSERTGNKIADELQRLCCAETEGAFFDYVTEAVGTIATLLRERDALHDMIGEQRGMDKALREARAFIRGVALDPKRWAHRGIITESNAVEIALLERIEAALPATRDMEASNG